MSYNESLRPNSNYPAMTQSQWDSSPFNEPIVPECNFDLDVQVTLSRKATIKTDNYTPCVDEEGYSCANTYNTDWVQEYKEKCYTIPELLETLKGYVKQDLERYKGSRHKEIELKEILDACERWTVEELEVSEL